MTRDCPEFRGTLGVKVLICRPADPEAKGLLERAHDDLERSFLPGRTFRSPADFTAQLGHSGDAHLAAGRSGDRVAGVDPAGT